MAYSTTEARERGLEDLLRQIMARLNALEAAVSDVRTKALQAPPVQMGGFAQGQIKAYRIASTIGPRTSLTAPTSGSGNLLNWNGATYDLGASVTIWNRWNVTVPAGDGVAYYDGGDWFDLGWDC